ncbi:MAG: hypothetical protein GYB32_10145 [Algicola sp.]|nr:hypothetical protein [Algicola sp.]
MNNDKQRKVLTEIATVTRTIEDSYPELQKYLDETRSTLPHDNDEGSLDLKDLENYLQELKSMISKYENKH